MSACFPPKRLYHAFSLRLSRRELRRYSIGQLVNVAARVAPVLVLSFQEETEPLSSDPGAWTARASSLAPSRSRSTWRFSSCAIVATQGPGSGCTSGRTAFCQDFPCPRVRASRRTWPEWPATVLPALSLRGMGDPRVVAFQGAEEMTSRFGESGTSPPCS